MGDISTLNGYNLKDAQARSDVSTINGKIPSGASSSNKLATASDLSSGLAGKVDKVTGKGLSTNDYSNTDKGIVDKIQDNVIANTKLIKDTVGWSGKNLLPITTSSMILNGITVTKKEKNILHFEGTATTGGCSYTLGTGDTNKKFYAGKYKLTYEVEGTTDASSPAFTRTLKSADDTVITNDWNFIGANDTNKVITVEVTGTDYFDSNRIWIPAGRTVNCDVKVMILEPDILDLSYEPYFGSTAFPRSEQVVLGAKNLLKNECVTETKNGITATVNSDGTITVNGTATAEAIFNIHLYSRDIKLSGNLILNGCPNGGTNETYQIYLQRRNAGNTGWDNPIYRDFGSGVNVTVEDGRLFDVNILIRNGTTLNNLIFKPMLRLATDPDDTYVPYAMTNRELTEMLSLTEHTVTGTTDENGLLVVSNIPHHPIIYCFGAPSGGGNCYAEARPGGGGIAFYLHNVGTKVASTEVTVHYYDFVK